MHGDKGQIKENHIERLGGLDPSVYSEKKFIAYIARYLREEGWLDQEFEFLAGNKMEVKVVELGDRKAKVVYSYNDGAGPMGSVTSFTAECGEEFAPGKLEIEISVTRKSYPLKFIRWQEGVLPAINEDVNSLAGLKLDQEFKTISSNASHIGPNETLVAKGGRYEDIYGQFGLLQSLISRRIRHFWGSIPSRNFEYDIHDSNWDNVLGGLPGEITIKHGTSPSHFIIATTGNIEVFAQGLKVGVSSYKGVIINPYQANLDYGKAYNIYISTSRSTGDYTYIVKKV